MNNKRIKIIFLIGLIGACLTTIYFALRARKKLEQNHLITIGKIKSCNSAGRGSGGKLSLDYNITLNEKKYNSSTSYLTSEFTCRLARNYFVGKTFPAVYYPPDPSISTLMIVPSDFEHFGYPYPDSLNWVLKYYKK